MVHKQVASAGRVAHRNAITDPAAIEYGNLIGAAIIQGGSERLEVAHDVRAVATDAALEAAAQRVQQQVRGGPGSA
jgi:hypothetical protein